MVRVSSVKENDPEIDQQFAAFWSEYPLKTARLAALKAYRKAIKRGVRVVDMVEALANQKALRASLERAGIWTPSWPYASTWLNGDRWADEVQPVKRLSDVQLIKPGEPVPGALTLEQVIEKEREREARRRQSAGEAEETR